MNIRSISGCSLLRNPKRLTRRKSSKKRGAFSLAETLVAVCLLFAAASLMTAMFANSASGDKIVRLEAADAAAWLEEKIAVAQIYESKFQMVVSEPHGSQGARIHMVWLTGPLRGQEDSYTPSAARLKPETLGQEFRYDGKWMTMTPSVTIRVRAPLGAEASPHYLTVSGVGYVSVRKHLGK